MTKLERAIGTGWIAGVLLIASGCGAGNRPDNADATQARAALSAALDAWKAGQKPKVLAQRSPPIHVKDVDWDGGFRLVDYKSEAEGKLVGYDMNYPVDLELRSPTGSSVKKKAVYTVTTRPELLVSGQEG
jgi:hypothetical protein